MNDEQIKCPSCGSLNWSCWDERIHYYEDKDGDVYEMPVGYLKCTDCGRGYTHEENNDPNAIDITDEMNSEDSGDFWEDYFA